MPPTRTNSGANGYRTTGRSNSYRMNGGTNGLRTSGGANVYPPNGGANGHAGHVPKPAPPLVAGREWKRDKKDCPAFFAAIVILAAWFAGAAYVIANDTYLPLNYWNDRFRGVLDNGNYNIVIAAAGNIGGAVVGWAIAQGDFAILVAGCFPN